MVTLGGMHGCSGGACVVAPGGVRGCSGGEGACVVAPGGVCVVAPGGACVVAPGGMRGCSGGHVWLLPGEGHVWLLQGVCMVTLGGMHGCSHGGIRGYSRGRGVHGCFGGACVVAPRGHAWLLPEWCAWDMMRYGDMINERAVRILLEYILVWAMYFHIS